MWLLLQPALLPGIHCSWLCEQHGVSPGSWRAGEEGSGLTTPSCLPGPGCLAGMGGMSTCLAHVLLSWEPRPALEHASVRHRRCWLQLPSLPCHHLCSSSPSCLLLLHDPDCCLSCPYQITKMSPGCSDSGVAVTPCRSSVCIGGETWRPLHKQGGHPAPAPWVHGELEHVVVGAVWLPALSTLILGWWDGRAAGRGGRAGGEVAGLGPPSETGMESAFFPQAGAAWALLALCKSWEALVPGSVTI